MRTPKFEQAKLKRLLSMHGKLYTFVRPALNEFEEPTATPEKQFVICGVYHENEMHIRVEAMNETRYRTEKQPLIMCEYERAKVLMVGDRLVINDVNYRVTNVRDVGNIGVYGDVSLEVVDDGGRT